MYFFKNNKDGTLLVAESTSRIVDGVSALGTILIKLIHLVLRTTLIS